MDHLLSSSLSPSITPSSPILSNPNPNPHLNPEATPKTITLLTTLPPEVLHLILTHLPKSTLPSIRLLNRTLEALAFPLLFRHLPNWLDYKTSHAAIVALANDAFERPNGMWSPWASEPDGEVQDVWLGLLWRVEVRGELSVGGVWVGGEGEREKLTAENYARLSGREEMCERRLRVAQNRYLMHRSYSEGAFKERQLVWEEKEL